MNKSNLKTYKIRIFDYNFNQLIEGFQIQFNQDSTYQELKNHIIEKCPDILNKDYILSVNGYNPQLNSKIHKNTELITMIQENNESIIDTNKLPMNDDNINDEEVNESSSDEGYGILLGDLLKQGKNDNLGKKRERLNSFEEQDNLIKFNEDFEIISDFAPTNNELYNIFFNTEPLLYNTKKRIKRIINPEKIIKQNNLQRNFLDIEYLTVQSIKDDEIIYNEEKNYTQDEEIIRRKVIDEVNKDIIQKDFQNEYYKEETKKEAIEEIKEIYIARGDDGNVYEIPADEMIYIASNNLRLVNDLSDDWKEKEKRDRQTPKESKDKGNNREKVLRKESYMASEPLFYSLILKVKELVIKELLVSLISLRDLSSVQIFLLQFDKSVPLEAANDLCARTTKLANNTNEIASFLTSQFDVVSFIENTLSKSARFVPDYNSTIGGKNTMLPLDKLTDKLLDIMQTIDQCKNNVLSPLGLPATLMDSTSGSKWMVDK